MKNQFKINKIHSNKLFVIFLYFSFPILIFSQKVGKTPSIQFEVVSIKTIGTDKYGLNKVFVYLEEKAFNRKNLIELFTYFSTLYPERPLKISVYTNKEILLWDKSVEDKGIPDFLDNTEGEKAKKEFFDKNYSLETSCFEATYYRNNLSEYFYYTPFKDRSGSITVTLRNNSNFVNSTDFLFESVKIGHLDAVDWFLSKNSKLNIKDKEGITPLIWALMLYHDDITRNLIEAGADVNEKSSKGVPPIIYATNSGNYEGLKLLAESKVNINAVDSEGRTALMASTHNCNFEMTKFLLDKGADKNIKNSQGRTALNDSCNERMMKLLTP